jgi:hypothetical protein
MPSFLVGTASAIALVMGLAVGGTSVQAQQTAPSTGTGVGKCPAGMSGPDCNDRSDSGAGSSGAGGTGGSSGSGSGSGGSGSGGSGSGGSGGSGSGGSGSGGGGGGSGSGGSGGGTK